jgi:hypothetical protein
VLKLKPHKTIQKIANKHGVSTAYLDKQLQMGIKIEHEHTISKDVAKDIALQHLDEFPDYYTKLKKMEKNSKSIKESHIQESKEQRYCPLCQKREQRSECSYGEKVWDKVSVKDEEYSMVRSELKTIEDAIKRLKNTVGKGEGNLEAWVQSKITRAADYIDTVADYLQSGEHNVKENVTVRRGVLKGNQSQIKRSTGAGALTPDAAKQLGSKAVKLQKKEAAKVDLPKFEERLVDRILNDLKEEDPCWAGYTQVGMKKKGKKKVPNCVPSKGVAKAKGYKNESTTLEDADGNTFVEIVDLIRPEPIDEATRLQAETGNIISVTLSWRGKYYAITMFFPQTKLPSRKEVTYEIQKIYPDSKVIHHSVSEVKPGQPIIRINGRQGGDFGKFGPNKNYVKPMGEGVEIDEAKKSEMPCNKPKAQAHGSGETGKSHVVKACEGGKEKLIRFGQLGVKGSPKKKGESEAYASRRHRFQTRHAKNIAKGKMSAAYWANKVKW